MPTYKIWCKEKAGTKGADQGNMISALDWSEVQGRMIEVDDANCLAQIGNGDTLRIFAHGSIDKVGSMTAQELANFLYQKGLRQAAVVELVACDTAINTRFKKAFAKRLLEHMVKGNRIAVTQTKGARGSLSPSRDGDDAVEVDGGIQLGDAGKKTYGTVQNGRRLRAVTM